MKPEPSDEFFERIAERLKALADPTRLCRTVCDALEQRAESEHRLLSSVALAARKASS